MKQTIMYYIASFLLGATLATNFWLKTMPEDYIQLYEQQTVVIDKCMDRIGVSLE